MRATGSNDIVLDEVFVPDSAVGIRRTPGVWSPPFHTIDTIALPLVYSVYVGVAERARDLALREASKKRQGPDRPALVGEMDNELTTARLALRHMIDVAATDTIGAETTNAVLVGRTLAGRAAIGRWSRRWRSSAAPRSIRALGLERLFRDVQGARYHQVREPAQVLYAGRLALGLDVNG